MRNLFVFCILVFALSSLFPVRIAAQNELNLYNMTIVPQRIFQNPSFIPEQKRYIGIPFLSGLESSYAIPFSYNDVAERDSYDSITLDVDNFLAKLEKNNQFRAYSNAEIISLGTQVAQGKFFLGISVRQRISQQVTVPADLGNLLWYGNGSPELFGQEVNIAPSANAVVYDEWGLSFSGYALKHKMTWGGRLKYLSGMMNINTVKSEFVVTTDTLTYELTVRSDIELQTSAIDKMDEYLDQKVPKIIFPGNNGAGLDLGISYRFNDKIGISASILDIGFINWKSNTMTIVSADPGAEVVFDGFNLNDFTDMLGNLNTYGQHLRDSILDIVHLDTLYGTTYTTWLPVRYNLGGTYSINEKHHFNLLLNSITWNHVFNPALSVSYYYTLPKKIGLMLSYNLFNNSYTNFGAGLSLSAGPVQLYASTDNLPGLIYYKGSNNRSLRFGINISINHKTATPAQTQPLEGTPVDEAK